MLVKKLVWNGYQDWLVKKFAHHCMVERLDNGNDPQKVEQWRKLIREAKAAKI